MNDLIGNNYEATEEQAKAKKWMKIIGVILALLLLVCIGLIVWMYYIQASQLKVAIDGKANPTVVIKGKTKTLEEVLLIDEGKVYVAIRDFAYFVGYESYSGDYKQYAEDETKCYVQSANELASFTMNSDKIYKLLTNGNDYEYFTINEPVKMINGVLYTTKEGAEKAFNITFDYNAKQNKITIYTLPYLVKYYAAQFKNSAIAGEGQSFSNQKALLYNMIIVKNADNYYGVYDLSGNEIIGTKYASIKFIEGSKEFIVTTAEKKMGIMSYDATTKIRPEYDEIKQIDKDLGLYLITNNKKQGVINNSGNTIIYMEYDQIGVDISKYNSNNVKNQYLLYDNCIPVKRNNQWGIFDKSGKQILPIEYEDFGCSVGAGAHQIANTNNVLLVPEYEGIVVRKDGLYGLIDSKGNQLLPIALKSIYSTTSEGEETYRMIYNNQEMNVITYIQTYVRPTTENNSPNENNTNTNDNVNGNNTNENNTSNTNNTITVNNTQTTNTTNQQSNNNSLQTSTNVVNEPNKTVQNNANVTQ